MPDCHKLSTSVLHHRHGIVVLHRRKFQYLDDIFILMSTMSSPAAIGRDTRYVPKIFIQGPIGLIALRHKQLDAVSTTTRRSEAGTSAVHELREPGQR